jgi:hypothetical protein
MASKEPTGVYKRPPIFNGENYDYWKECMSVHIQSVDMDVWDDVAKGQFEPQLVANGAAQDKPKAGWSDDDKEKV